MRIELRDIPVPEGLETAVIGRIRKEARAARLRGAFTFGSLLALSLVGLVASCSYAWSALSSSGLGGYASLVLAEGFGAIAYARELALVALESLPVLGLMAVAAACFATAWSAMCLYARGMPRFGRQVLTS